MKNTRENQQMIKRCRRINQQDLEDRKMEGTQVD